MARFCTQCGSELPDGIAFCTQCGAKAEQAAPAPQQTPKMEAAVIPTSPTRPAPQPVPQPVAEKPADKAISTGAFFGLMFLFSLPVLGWLVCLIMAFAAKNKNIRHFAQATLIWLVIALVLSALLGLAVRALIHTVTPYLEQALGQLGIVGGLEDMNELGSLGDVMGELEGLIPETTPVG